MRAWLAAVVLAMLVLGSSMTPAAASTDGTFTSSSGVTWQAHSREEFESDPKVQDVSRVMAEVATGAFRARVVQQMEGDYYTDEYVYAGGVTRVSTKDYAGKRTITYLKGDRQCQRKAASKKDAQIRFDDLDRFTCGKRKAGIRDGKELLGRMRPDAIQGVGGDPRFLTPVAPVALEKGELAALPVLVRDAEFLASYGLAGGPPLTEFRYWIGLDTFGMDRYDFNGYSSMTDWSQVWSQDVPTLPKAVIRAVR